MSDGPGLIVHRADSFKEGSCNFCTRWYADSGPIAHKVICVRSRDRTPGIQVRFCAECFQELQKARP